MWRSALSHRCLYIICILLFSEMLRIQTIQEWVKICKADFIPTKILRTWRWVVNCNYNCKDQFSEKYGDLLTFWSWSLVKCLNPSFVWFSSNFQMTSWIFSKWGWQLAVRDPLWICMPCHAESYCLTFPGDMWST